MKKLEKHWFGCDYYLKFGKYCIRIYEKNNAHNINFLKEKYGKGTVIFEEHIRKGFALPYGAYNKNIIRKITFNKEDRSITFVSRNIEKKNFKKTVWKNITNKEFFEYVRNHFEKLFYAYDVTPNSDRTEFKMVKKAEYINNE
ncbi:MAG: hypothetical protein HUJ68_01795 [Clostridia bacterium]|nr:hypothetical protein [Clostridia bacterium]